MTLSSVSYSRERKLKGWPQQTQSRMPHAFHDLRSIRRKFPSLWISQ